MDQFCQECGKKLRSGDNVCIYCGTPIQKKNADQQNQTGKRKAEKQRKPIPKKKKIIYISLSAIIGLLIAFSVWAQSYQSPESVEKRFAKAISEKDVHTMQKLLVHENGSDVTKEEAKALMKLVEEEGKSDVEGLFTVAPHGKFLVLFTAHKVEAIDQFAKYSEPVEGLSFTFNGKEIPEYERNKEVVLYGPLIPGIYDVEAVFKGEYGKTKKEGLLTLSEYSGDETNLDMDVNVSKVVFHIDNYDEIDHAKSSIQLGDEKIPIDKEGNTKEIGPFILDGSQKVQTVVSLPWGEVVSEPIDINENEMTMHADVLSKKQFGKMQKTLKNFGEHYVESIANQSTKPLKSVTEDVKEFVSDEIMEGLYYSGEFKQVEIDRNSVQVDNSSKQPKIELLTQYVFNETYHEIDEEPDLYEEVSTLQMQLSYDQEKKKWTILSVEPADIWGGFTVTDTAEGSKKMHGPSKEAMKEAKNKSMKEDISLFMDEYAQASVDAINYRDFDFVKDYISADGPRWKEAKEYIDYLDSKGITEDWLGTELETVKELDSGQIEVTVIESFTIDKPDSSTDKTYRTKVTLKEVDGEYKVHELIETNEI